MLRTETVVGVHPLSLEYNLKNCSSEVLIFFFNSSHPRTRLKAIQGTELQKEKESKMSKVGIEIALGSRNNHKMKGNMHQAKSSRGIHKEGRRYWHSLSFYI